jgi:ELWxxDGT repeat protein
MRFIAPMMILIMMTSTLAGCTGGDPDGGGNDEIDIDALNSLIEDNLQDFMNNTTITVENHYHNNTTYITGSPGFNGTNGSASPNTILTDVSVPDASLSCNAGGRVIKHGLDNGDGGGTPQNGVLEVGEVDYTTTFCSRQELSKVANTNIGWFTSGFVFAEELDIVVGNTIYFCGNDGNTGFELWAHDTLSGLTWQVADINSGAGSSGPGRFLSILVHDTIYFSADDGDNGDEIWAHDTSNGSTWRVTTDLFVNTPSSGLSTYAVYQEASLIGDTILFAANGGSGDELWAHDTLNGSTWQVADINPDSSNSVGSMPGAYLWIVVGDTLYFSAWDGNAGHELWAHDTSNGSIWRVNVLNSSLSQSVGYGGEILVGDTIYYSGGTQGRSLLAYDASNESVWLVKAFNSSFRVGDIEMLHLGDTIFFDAGSVANGKELWAHNTSNGSTWVLTNFSLGNPILGLSMQIIGDSIYFVGSDGNTGYELWEYDTLNGSTSLVADINSGVGSSTPGLNGYWKGLFLPVENRLYFSADDGGDGSELWVHDTLNGSTWQIRDLNSGPYESSNPGSYLSVVVGDTLYFSAYDGSAGNELWALGGVTHTITYS